MAKRTRERKCRCCGVFFTPDDRNRRTQRYCSRPGCRKASKAPSQRRWFGKPENRDYYRGLHNVERVRDWRKAHAGYSRNKGDALQDRLPGKDLEILEVKSSFVYAQPAFAYALQDVFSSQHAVLIGLISHLTGSALQDDIAKTARRLQELGSDILNRLIPNTGGINDQKASHLSPAPAPGAQPVQLGGPPPGA